MSLTVRDRVEEAVTDLPAFTSDQPARTIPKHGPRPTQVKLSEMILTLLSPYYQEADLLEAQVEAFRVALDDLPGEALSRAIVERLRSADRRRPIPGEIRASAHRYIRFSQPEVVVDNTQPFGRDDKELVTAQRARELIAEVGDSKLGASLLRMIEDSERGRVPFEDVLRTVSEQSGITPERIKGKGTKADEVAARFVVVYLASEYSGLSNSKIGGFLSDRDHTTIGHALSRVPERLREDAAFRDLVLSCKQALGR